MEDKKKFRYLTSEEFLKLSREDRFAYLARVHAHIAELMEKAREVPSPKKS